MDGIIIINKEQGRTSHDIVYRIKKILNEKVGHTGTLDPNATGVLPLLIGKGTECSQYLINHDKIYEATLKLGIKTDTADGEGKVLEEKEIPDESLKQEKVEEVLQSFQGKQEQIPPMYSAIKVNGKKLYEYARKGENIEIKPREIEIYKCELKNIDNKNKEISFIVHCSKGTYIRTLCEDIAKKLNTIGYMKVLNRIQVGEFSIKQAITVDDIEKNYQNEEYIQEHLITIEKLFYNKKEITINNQKLKHFLNGVKITYKAKNDLYRIYNEEKKFIGIGEIKNELLKRKIIL